MNLLDSLAWAVVELEGEAPDLNAVKAALENAYVKAANLDITHKVAQGNFVRLARATGGY